MGASDAVASTSRASGRPRTIDADAVSLIALRLFDEQGYESVSMDDVAEAAGVSRRSLFRLFPNKATLVWGGLEEFADRFQAALQTQSAATATTDALRVAYRIGATFPDETLEITRRRLRVIRMNPALEQVGSATATALTAAIVGFVADRTGRSVDELDVTVRAHAIAAAASAALTWWALHGQDRPEEVIDQALAFVT
jgi:AcrR family transcriptional regulator